MKKEDVIDIIVQGLQASDKVKDYFRILNNKGLQIRMIDNTYFNIGMSEINKKEGFVVKKLRK